MTDSQKTGLYAVAGVTGNTGAAAASVLIKSGAGVRAIVRDPKKGESWVAQGTEVAVADLGDVDALTKALRGVDGAYLLVPPDMGATDFLASRRTVVDSITAAVAASGVPHVVFLSSIGGQHKSGTGLIQTLYYGEDRLGALDTSVTFLRAAYFIENWAAVVGAVTGDGVLPTMFRADLSIPQVATGDIGRVAAEALLDGPKGKKHIIELAGPEDASPNDIAAVFGDLAARSVNVAEIPHEAQVPTAMSFGFPENVAQLFFEMHRGVESGKVGWEGGNVEFIRGTTSARDVLGAIMEAGEAQ
ncbi:MAG: NmrA family NAD(P)-binding protein [Candidatus Krumholzibacteriota bacterium]|nr:NmrA family NAD(P)-binding protein [Candidatus Krumholzibacteriota bacterium]